MKEECFDVKGEFSEKILAVERRTLSDKREFEAQIELNIGQKIGYELRELKKKSFKTEIEENMSQKIKILEMQLVMIPVREETRDFLQSRDIIKLSTFKGKSSWDVNKKKYTMVAEANGWDKNAKAFHLSTSLKSDAANILQTLIEEERHDYGALVKAIKMPFGENFS